MTRLAHSGGDPHPTVSALLPHLSSSSARLCLDVAADDEMLTAGEELFPGRTGPALAEYFLTGRRIADVWVELLHRRYPGRDGLRILDFGSGWGRVTRYLAAELPEQELFVADPMTDAAAFQRATLGVRVLPIPDRPDSGGDSPPPFDAIFAASVFTHLPEASFHAWLEWLLGRLAPGGFLAFTASSPEVLPGRDSERAEAVFSFGGDSENRVLDDSVYGTAWMREPFVREAVVRHDPDATLLAFPRRICHFQDLYVVIAPPGRAESLRHLGEEPRVMLEEVRLTADGGLVAEGWVAGRGDAARSGSLEAWSGETRQAEADPGPERTELARILGEPDLRGWSWRMTLPPRPGGIADPLVLVLRYHDGRSTPVLAGTPEEWIRRASELSRAESSRRAAFYARRYAEVAAALEATGWERRRLEQRIEAMERSRFWRARRLWFRVKRAVGLPARE